MRPSELSPEIGIEKEMLSRALGMTPAQIDGAVKYRQQNVKGFTPKDLLEDQPWRIPELDAVQVFCVTDYRRLRSALGTKPYKAEFLQEPSADPIYAERIRALVAALQQ